MSGLVLKLGPSERLMINGVVVENGDRRSRIHILTPDANVLRLRDALHPSDADTPVKRLHYIVQLVLAGEAKKSEANHQLLLGLNQMKLIFKKGRSCEVISLLIFELENARHYRMLKLFKELAGYERTILGTAA